MPRFFKVQSSKCKVQIYAQTNYITLSLYHLLTKIKTGKPRFLFYFTNIDSHVVGNIQQRVIGRNKCV